MLLVAGWGPDRALKSLKGLMKVAGGTSDNALKGEVGGRGEDEGVKGE